MTDEELLEKAKGHYSSRQITSLSEAIQLATTKHEGQMRASGLPYISHPLNVASILIDWRLDIDSVITGVLHDTIEDTDLTLADIESKFGHDIAFLVDGVTLVSKARSGMKHLSSYLPQTKDNLSKLLVAISQDIRVLIIKLADRLDNLRSLEYKSIDKQMKIADESLSVFAPMADRLGMSQVKSEIEEISFKYLFPKDYEHVTKLIKKRVGRSAKDLKSIEHSVAKELAHQKIEFMVDGRIKNAYSLYKKLRKSDPDQIYDYMALRITVEDKETCYKVLGIIHSMYQPMLKKIKDYISIPKPNGYQSLHTTVITPSQQIVEFQIRTKEMHEYAERGLAASFHYNEQKVSKDYIQHKSISALPRNLHWILELQETAKRLQAGEIPEGGLNVDLFSDRIFVLSPKGDIYDLPEGSTVIDFAFAVHSDIGSHIHTAEINHKIAKLFTPLNNGDIVSIRTRPSSHPSKEWLDHVKSAKARQKIKASLKNAQISK